MIAFNVLFAVFAAALFAVVVATAAFVVVCRCYCICCCRIICLLAVAESFVKTLPISSVALTNNYTLSSVALIKIHISSVAHI